MVTIPNALREAVRLVRANPAAIDALDAEEAAAAKSAAAEAKRIASLHDKLAAALPDRIERLVADYRVLEQEALQRAAQKLAAAQLEQELGLVPARTAAMAPASVRLGRLQVENSLAWLLQNAPIPWDSQQRPAAILRSDQARAASELLNPPIAPHAVDDIEARRAAAAQRQEAARQRRISDEKAKLRAAGVLPKP
ncbi:MAG: hypothetical protein IT341_09250 [Chloroflexi bacterium]|nr:hypothetical protein [Chloroflexota bacterium]